MEWPHDANGSAPDLTLLLGETVANTRTIMNGMQEFRTDIREVRNKVEFLLQENVQRRSDHQSLREKVEEAADAEATFSIGLISEWMEKGGEALEIGKSVAKALLTFWTTTVWLLSGTAAYKMIVQPLEAKHLGLSILAFFGLSP